MNLYPLMFFVHVTSDIGIFVGIGAWLFGLAALRRRQQYSASMPADLLEFLARFRSGEPAGKDQTFELALSKDYA
jgi:hypothetical protein